MSTSPSMKQENRSAVYTAWKPVPASLEKIKTQRPGPRLHTGLLPPDLEGNFPSLWEGSQIKLILANFKLDIGGQLNVEK
jgi:hypothetical protein